MKRFITSLVLGVLVLACAPTAFAEVTHRYISGHLGAGIHPDATTTTPGFACSTPCDLEVDTGAVIGAAIGVGLANHFRFEGELAWHDSSIDDPQFFFPGESLNISVLSIMANGYYDFDLNAPFKPYVGAGVDFGFIRAEHEFFGFVDEDTDIGFAYQLMTGVAFDLSPRSAITLGYRYFDTTDLDVATFGFNFQTEFTSHEFLVGVRFQF